MRQHRHRAETPVLVGLLIRIPRVVALFSLGENVIAITGDNIRQGVSRTNFTSKICKLKKNKKKLRIVIFTRL